MLYIFATTPRRALASLRLFPCMKIGSEKEYCILKMHCRTDLWHLNPHLEPPLCHTRYLAEYFINKSLFSGFPWRSSLTRFLQLLLKLFQISATLQLTTITLFMLTESRKTSKIGHNIHTMAQAKNQ